MNGQWFHRRLHGWGVGLIWCLCAAASTAQDDGFREEYALAADRSAVLKKLVPGTEEYFYYHALYAQQTEQFERADALLAEWRRRRGETPRWRMIRHRQALLTYDRNPQQTLDYLKQQLKLTYPARQAGTHGANRSLPSQLDPALIDANRLAGQLLKDPKSLRGFQPQAWFWLASKSLSPAQRHAFLQAATRPDLPNLVGMIVDDFKARMTTSFGQLKIHTQLTRSQLDELASALPELRNQQAFVATYLRRLAPAADARADDPQVRRDHLARMWKFVATLPAAHNSLKTNILFHLLDANRQFDQYDKKLFMEYLKLPRRVGYINPTYLREGNRARIAADLNANFAQVTFFPPVRNDESLVRAYLEHFFQDETDYKTYELYLKDSFVKRVFAEAKILYGLGDAKQWANFLSPAEYAAIVKRVELRFAAANPQVFRADDPVALELDIKNVPTLLVKIYRINTWNYYRTRQEAVDTDIDLDGLVPNWEQRYEYKELPQLRKRRRFAFPQMDKPGVYVVDFIGNGKQSRVVVRKGHLSLIANMTPAGQRVTVLNEQREVVPGATVWMGGRVYEPDDRGSVLIPFSSEPSTVPVILSDGDFHVLAHFAQRGESYRLEAGIVVNRESLLAGQEAAVLLRPQLLLNNEPVSLSILTEPRLSIRSTDVRGVATTSEVDTLEISEDREAVHIFRVPPRTRSIQFVLQGKVKSLIRAKDETVTATQTYDLNAIDNQLTVAQLLLAQVGGQYEVHLVGRNGEPLSGRPLEVTLSHEYFTEPIRTTLQTDPLGRVFLGGLPGIHTLAARLLDESLSVGAKVARQWSLRTGDHSWRDVVHAAAGDTIELPLISSTDRLDRALWSLIELRQGQPAIDRFNHLRVRDGMLLVRELPPGDYRLEYHRGLRTTMIRIGQGPKVARHVVSTSRQLELRGSAPLQISQIELTDQSVRIALTNHSKFSRVHVFANRYHPAYDAYAVFSRVGDVTPRWNVEPRRPNLFLQERRLGDEYRYILDRRLAKKFPGNMLERPSFLLDPWARQTAENEELEMADGEALKRRGTSSGPARANRARARAGGKSSAEDPANLDFLARPPARFLNLTPNADGWIELPREPLRWYHELTIVAVDPDDTVLRNVSLSEAPEEFVDLRLPTALDTDRHYVQTKRVTVVPAGESFLVADYRSSRLQVYDDLAKLYGMYRAFVNDPRLGEFQFITRWHTYDVEKKQEYYSKYASHELNVFLFFKDRAFFDAVVKPYLANKTPRRFVDRWLLGEPLDEWNDSWQREQLNAFERAVWAQRSGQLDDVLKDWRPVLDEQQQQPDAQSWFEVALRGQLLEQDKGGVLMGGYGGIAANSRQLALGRRPMAEGGREGGEVARFSRKSKGAPAPGKPASPSTSSLERLQEKAEFESLSLRKQGARAESKKALDRFYEADDAARDKAASLAQLYVPVERTRQWVETYYYGVPLSDMNAALVPWSRLWVDFAQHAEGKELLSTRLAEAHQNATTVLLAMAVTGLPFKAAEHDVKTDGTKMTILARSPLVAFHEQIEEVVAGDPSTPMMVSQVFFDVAESNAEAAVVKDREFLVGKAYGCRVVLSNPSSRTRVLDVLTQVPQGAIPLKGTRPTESHRVSVPPYATQSFEYYFYFPATGEFAHYPVHVAERDELVAFATPESLKVVTKRTSLDRGSWADVAANGTHDEVITFLEQHSLRKVDLGLILWRLRDRSFYDRLLSLLEKRKAYDHRVWSYAIFYGDAPSRIEAYLQHADAFVAACGMAIDSPILHLHPIERKSYEHIEFRPLIRSRAHRVAGKPSISNERLNAQYQSLLEWLCQSRQIDPDRRLELTYYLLLQGRIEEASDHFAQVDRRRVDRKMQYDYCQAYLAFYTDDPEPARDIAEKYARHPVPRWRNAFQAILAQLDEISSGATRVVDSENREQRQAAAAAQQPVLELAIEGDEAIVRYRNLAEARVNYYPMDIEFLFSRNPFVQQFGTRFGQVTPYRSTTIKLKPDADTHRLRIPEDLKHRHMLIEVVGDGVSAHQVRFASALRVELAETQGMLRVLHVDQGRPIPKTYVKVYARMANGSVEFYKDGYTDLRGRFDYVSLSTDKLSGVQRFAILVLSPENGAEIREVAPPAR